VCVSPFTNPIRKHETRQQRRTTETTGDRDNAEEPKQTEDCAVRDEDIVDAVPLAGQYEEQGMAARSAQVRKHGVCMRSILGLSGVVCGIHYVLRRALIRVILDCCAGVR